MNKIVVFCGSRKGFHEIFTTQIELSSKCFRNHDITLNKTK